MIKEFSHCDILQSFEDGNLETAGPSSQQSVEEYEYFRIFQLEQEIMFLTSIFHRRKEKDCYLVPERQLSWENDLLKIEFLKWKNNVDGLEELFNIVKNAHSGLVDNQIKFHLDNTDKFQSLDMVELLKNTEMDLYESTRLINELKKVAWELLPPKIGKYCASVEKELQSRKRRLGELEQIIQSARNNLRTKKGEYSTLIRKIENMTKEDKLLKIKIKRASEIKDNWKKRLLKISKKVLLGRKLLNSYGLNSVKEIKIGDENVVFIDENSEEDKLKYLLTNKIENLLRILMKKDKEIELERIEIETHMKNNEIIKRNNIKILKMKDEINLLNELKKEMTLNLKHEIILRKTYHNEIEDLKGKIRVFCRCRPINRDEMNSGRLLCVSFPDIYTIMIHGIVNVRDVKEFQFDKVYTMESSQEEIFLDSEKLIQSAFDGYNVCIFAYGQTGSGKTYTLIGNIKIDPGIIPRSFNKILEIVNSGRTKFKFELKCYMLELYNEKLLDLLTADAEYTDNLEIKKDFNGMVTVPGASIISTVSIDELKELFNKGNTNRHIAATKMNSESSRSHLIFTIIINCRSVYSEKRTYGKLSIIDLAGSERLSKSGSKGVCAQEAMSINMSLSSLGDVISALTSGLNFIPYRNNKLTLLMQDSLGGNAKTLMFVNISPVDYNGLETITSLTYAARVKLIKNDASKIPDIDQIEKLQKIIALLLKGEDVII